MFFGGSALYGVLSFSPFTYHQFIGPHVVRLAGLGRGVLRRAVHGPSSR